MEAILEIQKFLRACSPLSAVRRAAEKWGLNVCEEGDLVQFTYSMIDSPRGVPEVEECRGLILCKPTWDIVAYPFRRFYNVTEPQAVKIPLEFGTLLEKLDGTLMMTYAYGGTTFVATKGRIFADGPVGECTLTFKDLFWQAVEDTCKPVYHDARAWPQDHCMLFEVTSPANRIVTPYDKTTLHLLAARRVSDWQEVDQDVLQGLADELGAPRPKEYEFTDADHIDNMLKMMSQLREGFVMVSYDYKMPDGRSYPRVKIKNPQYLVAARYLGNRFEGKRVLAVVMEGEQSEVLAYFPEFKAAITSMEKAVYDLIDLIEAEHRQLAEKWPTVSAEDRKAFAEDVKACRFAPYHFLKYDGRVEAPMDWLIGLCPVSARDGTLVVDRLYKMLMTTTLR